MRDVSIPQCCHVMVKAVTKHIVNRALLEIRRLWSIAMTAIKITVSIAGYSYAGRDLIAQSVWKSLLLFFSESMKPSASYSLTVC